MPTHGGAYTAIVTPRAANADSVRQLVDDYRDRCLWFLRRDSYPVTTVEQLTVLDYVERYGDLAAYQRARALRQWLSPNSSAASAG